MSAAETDLRHTLIEPDWPAPSWVRAVSTTRRGGVSEPPYASLNLGFRSGDDAERVRANRRALAAALALPREPAWLRQVHGKQVVDAAEVTAEPVQADAAFTCASGPVCVVMTADCLPVLLCDRVEIRVAAAHAGWRGLACGVIGATVAALRSDPADLLAWLGPAIGPAQFEVGAEVRQAFLDLDAGNADCFKPSPAGRWLADIYGLARRQLRALGVGAVYGGGWCTVSEHERFFSFRRDGAASGRMASLIWVSPC